MIKIFPQKIEKKAKIVFFFKNSILVAHNQTKFSFFAIGAIKLSDFTKAESRI